MTEAAQNPRESLLATLQTEKLPLADLLRTLDALDAGVANESIVKIGLSANLTTDLLGTFLRRHAWQNGVRATVVPGQYAAHIDNLRTFAQSGVDLVVIVPLFDNLEASFEARIASAPPGWVEAVRERTREELRLCLVAGCGIRQVVVCQMHRIAAPMANEASDGVDAVLATFNAMLIELAAEFPNVHLLDTTAIVRALGWTDAINPRFYFQFKAPYTAAFVGELARRVVVHARLDGRYRKVLVLDCDNTLWGGVVGEDLLAGIKLGPHSYPGNVFWLAQLEFLRLQRAGVVLALCSKNNAADVDQVLRLHPDMVLRDEHLVLKKVNWASKVENLRAIAAELNVGLDSLVFVDDSEFECAAVQSQLPAVRTLQVPKALYEYPAFARRLGESFATDSSAGDKTAQYQLKAQVEASRAQFANQDEYLRSLGTQALIRRDTPQHARRIAELTQKSNQFNLTTKRCSEAEILALMDSPESAVYSLHVSDRFGDHGLTGVALVHWTGNVLTVDNFLMSCRVIGRGVEFSCWRTIFADAIARGLDEVHAEFRLSEKNAQVQDFYDRLGLPLAASDAAVRRYQGRLAQIALDTSALVQVGETEAVP